MHQQQPTDIEALTAAVEQEQQQINSRASSSSVNSNTQNNNTQQQQHHHHSNNNNNGLDVSASSAGTPMHVHSQKQHQNNNNNNNNNLSSLAHSPIPATTTTNTSHNQMLFQNGKSPVQNRFNQDSNIRNYSQQHQHQNNNNNTNNSGGGGGYSGFPSQLIQQQQQNQSSSAPQSPFYSQNQQQQQYHHHNSSNINMNNHNVSYSAPEPIPFSPVPLQQSLQVNEALAAGITSSTTFDSTNNLNAASRQMYTALISKLKTQLDENQKQLFQRNNECDQLRRELQQRDRDIASQMHQEVKSRVDTERAQLQNEHSKSLEQLRNHYEPMVEQLHARVKTLEAESEELRLRVGNMTTKVTEAQAASTRDRQSNEAMHKRYEEEISSLRETKERELELLRKELEVARSSTENRDRVSVTQVSSLQADVRRLQTELDTSRTFESRLQNERDEDARRGREERELAQREFDTNLRRASERSKNAETAEREALDRALRAERQMSDERARRERMTEELAACEAKEHEAARALARREAEIARLEARVESLSVKANTYATEAAAVRHEFEVRDSRDRTEEKLQFDQRLISFRERTEQQHPTNNNSNTNNNNSRFSSQNNNNNNNNNFGDDSYHISGRTNNNNNNNSREQHHYSHLNNSGVVATTSAAAATGGDRHVASSVFQEALEATTNEIKDLKRALTQVPRHEYKSRGLAIENRIDSCLEEMKRLNDRVSRTEATQVRQSQQQAQRLQQDYQNSSLMLDSVKQVANQRQNQQNQNQRSHGSSGGGGMSPAMKNIQTLRNDLIHGRR